MRNDLLSSIAELTGELRRSQATLGDAMARARGVREGTDGSGTITIVIDDEGTARDVLVAADWRRRLQPAQLGAAVVEADTAAASRRAAATVEALESTDPATVPDGNGPAEAPAWLSPVVPAAGQRRDLAELSAAVFAALDDLDRITEAPPAVRGCGAQGAVEVRMARGRITECRVDEAWLARQDDVALAHALRDAVGAAAAAGLAAKAPFVDYQQRLRTLLADARATLAGPLPFESR